MERISIFSFKSGFVYGSAEFDHSNSRLLLLHFLLFSFNDVLGIGHPGETNSKMLSDLADLNDFFRLCFVLTVEILKLFFFHNLIERISSSISWVSHILNLIRYQENGAMNVLCFPWKKKPREMLLRSILTNNGKLESLISNQDLSVILISLAFAFEAKQFALCNGESAG
jgi:hypothetical protein